MKLPAALFSRLPGMARMALARRCWVIGWLGLAGLAAAATNPPCDWRHTIPTAGFQPSAEGEWTSPLVQPPFAFDELIYSWQTARRGDAFRLYLKAIFAPGDETDWLYAGGWSAVKDPVTKRERPVFDRGVLDMDWLKLKTKATGFRFKVVSAGAVPLTAPPSLTVIATDNSPPVAVTEPGRDAFHPDPNPPSAGLGIGDAVESVPTRFMRANPPRVTGRVLDVPLRRQFDSHGVRLVDRCQSAALASAMEYFGKSVPLEDIVRFTYDAEYQYPGIWPRVIGAAQEFGFAGYIERFRDWDRVRQALAENQILLCSMRLKAGECQSPPYPSMGNHIVALCGVTDDGRVVVTDSFLGKSGNGRLCQWHQADFEKVWMQAKGGIALVICPPAGAPQKLVTHLPPFPKDRTFPVGDDH